MVSLLKWSAFLGMRRGVSVKGKVTSHQVVQWSVIWGTSYCFCQGWYWRKNMKGCDGKINIFYFVVLLWFRQSWLWVRRTFLLKIFFKCLCRKWEGENSSGREYLIFEVTGQAHFDIVHCVIYCTLTVHFLNILFVSPLGCPLLSQGGRPPWTMAYRFAL